MQSEKSGMEHRMTNMSNDISLLRDRLQENDQEMSTNRGRLQEVTRQIDNEARRRCNGSEIRFSRVESDQ